MNEKNFSSEHRSVRSVSEMRVDLHIYIVPQELWREHLQSALNQVINETVSAGFIRVFPDTTVSKLREEIESQIGFEIIPREFVFLKCVGRCFTRIKSRQENLLKVKNFIPPQAYAPEMFILEATPDIRALTDSGSVSAQSQMSLQNGYHSDSGSFSGHSRVPPIKSHTAAVQTDRGSRVFSNSGNFEDCGDRRQRSSLAESLSECSHNSKSTQTHLTSQESPEIKKHNPKKSKNMFPRSSSPEDDGYDPPWNATLNHSPKLSLKAQKQAKSIQTPSEKETRELEERLRSQIETEKQNAAETEKAYKDRLKRRKQEEQRGKQEEKKRLEEGNWRREAGEKKKQEDEGKKRKEEELRKEEERRKEDEMEKEEEKRKEEQRKREEEEETQQEERRKLEEEKHRQKKIRQATEKATFLKEIEELKVARQDLEDRQDFLTKKTKLLQTKTPVNKHSVRDNWKKKYFEEKKKTAPLDEHGNRLKHHLDTLHKKLIANLESFPPPPPAPASSARTEATMKKVNSSSLHVKAKQLEHDIEDIQQQLEGVKMKLTGEIKLRNQAEKDIRVLRAELNQRKLQNHLKGQTPRTQYVTMTPKS